MSLRQSKSSILANSLLLAICGAYIAVGLVYLDNAAEIRSLKDTLNVDSDVTGFLTRAAWLTTGGVTVFVLLAEGTRRIGIAVSDRVVSLGLFLIVTANVAFSAWIIGAPT